MIQFVTHNNIDKKKWDACVSSSYNRSVSGYSWYLDEVFENWSALIYDDYRAVFPLPIKSKLSIKYFLQPLFLRCLAIYSKEPLTINLVDAFFDKIPNNIRLVEFYLQENIPFTRKDYSVSNRLFQKLNLEKPYDDIVGEYSTSVSKNLKKAKKSGLTITYKIAPEIIAKQYQDNIGKQVEKLDDEHFQRIENLVKSALRNQCGFCIGVENSKKEIVASAFFMDSLQVLYFSFGSANKEGKSFGAMYLMLDEVIKNFSQKRKHLDFEGSDKKGIADFNKNFGAEDCVYLQVKKNTLPPLVKWIAKKE